MRPGHTPGHTNWLLQSGGERLLIWGDIVHLAAVQLARPEARLIYDVDTELAAATRADGARLGGERAAHRCRRASRVSGLRPVMRSGSFEIDRSLKRERPS